MGVGQVTIRRKGREVAYVTGMAFDLDQLRGAVPAGEELEAEETPSEYLTDFDWPDVVEDETASVAPFIELLIGVRTQLRLAEQWALADEIRQQLSELGIVLEDSPTETTWRRADAGENGT